MKKKRGFLKFLRTCLFWLTYPRQLADAVNRAADWEELDGMLYGGVEHDLAK